MRIPRPALKLATLLALLVVSPNAHAAEQLSDTHTVLRQAREAAGAIQAQERRFNILTRIAIAQSLSKDSAGALATAHQALSITPTDRIDSSSLDELEALIAVQAGAGDRPGAARTLERLLRATAKDKGGSGQIIVAAAQARAGDFRTALNSAGQSPQALARVAEIQAQAGDKAAALTTLRRASEAAAAPPQRPSAQQLAYIAFVQFRAGDQRNGATTFAQAARVASGGGQPVASPMAFLVHLPALQQVAAAQIQAGDGKGASKTLEEALRFARMHPDDAGRTSNLNAIARAFAEAGDKAASIRVLREARAITNKIAGHSDQRSALLLEIAEIEAEAGYVKEAVQTLDHLWNSMWKATSKQMIQDAEAQIAKIRDERARSQAKANLNDLVGKLKTQPHWTTGLRVAFALGSDWLVRLAAIQAKVGNHAEAAITFQQAFEAASTSMPFAGTDPFSFERVALAQTRAGQWQAAFAWAGKLPEPEARAVSLLSVAKGLLQRLGVKSCEFSMLVC
jgi:hypothetical protein